MDEKYIIAYLEKHVPNFKINRRGQVHMFTCPDCETPETCRLVPGTNKINCMKCGLTEDLVGVAHLLGDTSYNETEEEIKDKLEVSLGKENTKAHTEALNFYSKSGFNLTPLQKNSKIPFEIDWLNKDHKDITEWEKWLIAGLNIGVKCGTKSNITIVDIDQANIPPDIDLLKGNPLIQKTSRGWHLIYKYVDLPTSKIDEYKIDLLNNGKQAVLYPSSIDNNAREFVTDLAITDMPADLLAFLKEKLKVSSEPKAELIANDANFVIDENASIDFISEGGRSNALMQIGGILSKELNTFQTEYTLNLLNRKLCNPPLSPKDISNVTRMISQYSNRDEKNLANQIYKYLHVVEFANSKEIKDALGFPKEDIDKALAYLVRELRLIKRGRNFYIIKKANWKTNLSISANDIDFELPFFSKYANLCYGDNVLLASGTKNGKTTIAMNFLRLISEQIKSKGLNRRLYYITSEAGSRFMKTALHLGLSEGDFEWDFVSDPSKITLEERSITILDWLMIEDKAQTDAVMKYFVDQLYQSNGFLITFMQLKESGDWFAPNMVKQFPALAARYRYTDEGKGIEGQWILDAIRDPKNHTKTGLIPCSYDFQTKILSEATP